MKRIIKKTILALLMPVVLSGSFYLNAENSKRYKSLQPMNHPYRKCKTLTPKLKQDTVIDCSHLDPNLYIYRFKEIVVDESDNIIVLTNNSVLKYDSRGKRLNHFTLRRGEGPGEVRQYPQSISRDPDGNIYLYDGYKYIKYNYRMEFISNIRLVLAGRVCIDKEGYIMGIKHRQIPGGIGTKSLVKFSCTGEPIITIVQFEDQNSRAHGNTTYGIIHAYSPNAYFAPLKDGIIYGHNMDYRLKKYDGNGNLTAIIALDEKPVPIISKEKDKILYPNGRKPLRPGTRKIALKFPKHRPFFKNILTDEKNRIYVIRRQSVLEKKREATIDIFSSRGQYLYRMRLPFEPRLIRNGNLYHIGIYQDSDGDDIYRINKYRFPDYHLMNH